MQEILEIIFQIVLLLWEHKGKTVAGAVVAGATGVGTYSWMESQRAEPQVMAFHGAPGVPTGPPFYVGGIKADGKVPTVQADNVTVDWEAGGGGGSGLTVTGTPAAGDGVARNTFDGTWEPTKGSVGVYDVNAYGGSGRGEITTTGTASAASTSLTLASATTFLKGQGVAILGAGASHAIAAPAAPILGTPTPPTFTANATSNVLTANGTLGLLAGDLFQVSNSGGGLPGGLSAATDYYYCPAVQWTFVDATDILTFASPQTLQTGDPIKLETTTTIPTGVSVATFYYVCMLTPTTCTLHPSALEAAAATNKLTLTGGSGTHYAIGPNVFPTTEFQLFTSNGNALANTSRIDISSAGTGTQSIAGTTTLAATAGNLTGDGGWSAVSAAGTLANCMPRPSMSFPLYYCTTEVAGNNGVFFGIRSNTQSARFCGLIKNGATNAYIVTFQAGGYTNAVATDVGKTVTRGGSTGILAGYDNTNRLWWIIPTVYGTDTFSSFGGATIGSGTGVGTSTAVAAGHVGIDTGDFSPIATSASGTLGATQPSLARRPNTVYYPGDTILHPMSTAGVQYVAVDRMPKKSNYAQSSTVASSALTLGTTVGTLYQDGDIYWMPMPRFQPVDEPTSAMPNAHLTTIASMAGNVATLNNAVTSAVTSQTVWHNEWKAITDALAARDADVNTACEIYFRPGYWNVITGDSEADTFTQWDDTFLGRNILFGTISSTLKRARGVRLSPAATMVWMSMGHRAIHTDAGDVDYFWSANQLNEQYWVGGRFIYAPAGEPILHAHDAWNRVVFFGDFATGDTDQFSQGAQFNDCQFWNVPRLILCATSNGYGRGHRLNRVQSKFGGAGHDAWAYGAFAEVCNCTIFGDEAFGSDILYTDDAGSDSVNDAMLIDGNRIFKSRVDGMRIRVPDAIITNNQWFDSKTSSNIILCDSTFRGVVNGNRATNGGVFRMTGTTYSMSGNNLKNAQLLIVGGTVVSITGGSVDFDTNASDYHAGAEGCVVVSGGTDVVVSGLQIYNAETSGPTPALYVTSTGRTELNGVRAYSTSSYGIAVTSGMSGSLNIVGGYYRGGTGPQAHLLLQNASGTCHISGGATFEANDAGNQCYADNGSLYVKSARFLCCTNFASTLDALSMIGNECPSANACIIATPNAVVRENNFAVAPTLTGITGLRRSKNSVNGSLVQTMTALAANTDNLLVGICDTLLLTTSGTNNYNLTGLAGLAEGEEITLFNGEASGTDTITLTHQATSTAGNQLSMTGGANYALDPGDRWRAVKMTALAATYYREIGRGP